ncbi:MAG: hypothetical protein H7834_12470 [Magnetococcus sp. YQC-9]
MSRWQSYSALMNRSCQDTFGMPIVYTPSLDNRMELGGSPVSLTGIFDERQEEVTILSAGSEGMGAVIPRLVLEIRISDLGFDPMAGDEVTISGLNYRVREVRTDGAGMAVLHLARGEDPFAF